MPPFSLLRLESALGRMAERFSRHTRLGSFWPLPCLLATAAIAGGTWISFRLGQNSGSVTCFYLVTVILTAYYGGLRQATLVSVLAVACLDYFFDEPILSFTVKRVSDWVELGTFEFTAVVISRLSNRVRLREIEAAVERRDSSRLYQAARRILLFENPGDTGSQVATLIRNVFELRYLVVFDAASGYTYASGHLDSATAEQTVVRLTRETWQNDSTVHMSEDWYCALRLGARPEGAIALCGTDLNSLTVSAIASLAAIALERARILEKQCSAEAAREAEQLRTAVLDSLAHKFKTPLTVIRTAAAGLPAAGDLSPLQSELVSLVDQEAKTLNDLACRLLETPALESGGFESPREPLMLSHIAKAVILELEPPDEQRRFFFSLPARDAPVLADRELMMTAIAQLADNALKYSIPESPIDIGVAADDTTVTLRIRNRGLEVSASDRERIFDRFYRAPGAKHCAPGTGLGLSIVRTIATDHDGRAWADTESGYGTVFFLSFPVMQEALNEP